MNDAQGRTDAAKALAALESIRDTRADTLARMDYWPWWYDAGYASACALLVGGQGFPMPMGPLGSGLAVCILVLIMRKWQARTGVWVNGYAPKRARWAAIGLGVILVGLIALSLQFGLRQGMVWVPLVNGAIAAVLGVAGMRVWMHLYRQDVKDLT